MIDASHPVWQFVGAFLAALGLFVTVVQPYLSRNRKQLNYRVLLTFPIRSEDLLPNDILNLKISKPIHDGYSFVIRFISLGNDPITRQDYERPITIELGKDAQIIKTEIIQVHPEDLEIEFINQTDNSVTIRPILLNSGDYFAIKFMINCFDETINIKGRIIGISEFRNHEDDSRHSALVAFLGAILLLIYAASSIWSLQLFSNVVTNIWMSLFIGVSGILLVFVVIFQVRRQQGRDGDIIQRAYRLGQYAK